MESVQNQVMQLYQDNLNYLQANHPELFKTLQVFEYALEQNEIEENYALELKDEGYFDIKDLKQDKWLYGEDSNVFSEKLRDNVSFKKGVSSFEGFRVEDVNNVEEAKKDEKNGKAGVYPLMSYYIHNIPNNEDVLSIRKFIFIGVGLGLHIPLIDAKIMAEDYLVIEDNFELFRLSLFVTPYCDIAKYVKFHFSIAQYNDDFTTIVQHFLATDPFYNRHIKFVHFAAHNPQKIKQIQSAILTQSFMIYPYGIQLKRLLFPFNYINNYKVLNLQEKFQNSCFENKPVLLIAAGPSLSKHIEWLQENHERFIIVAISAVVKILYKYNIVPDIVTHVDPFQTSLPLIEGFPIKEFLKNSSIILADFAPLKLHDIFSKEQTYRLSDRGEYFQNFSNPATPCVGSFSLLSALQFGAKEIYFLGLDLALDPKTGATHSSFHKYKQIKDTSKSDAFEASMSIRGTTMKVEGNFQKEVTTTSLFYHSIHSLFLQIRNFKSTQQTLYNLNDGAKFEDTQALTIEKVEVEKFPILDKTALSKEIRATFDAHSRVELTHEEIEILRKRLQETQELKNILSSYKKSITYGDTEKYIYNLGGLYKDIISYYPKSISKLVELIDEFFLYAYSLIIDFFNTKQIKNHKHHMKKLDKLMQKELNNIINEYVDKIEKFLKEKIAVS